MRNIQLELQYDGTRYQGWALPDGKEPEKTVSGKITNVLSRMSDEEVILTGAERTLPGVHAKKQIASFHTEYPAAPEEILKYLNTYLPLDIAIRSASEIPDHFQASQHIQSVTYQYRILISPVQDVFRRKYVQWFSSPLSVPDMEEASSFLLGRHDFRHLSSGRSKKGTERILDSIQFRETSDQELSIFITADRFLQKMPLFLVDILLNIGMGKNNSADINAFLSGEKKADAFSVPQALTLVDIQYSSKEERNEIS